MSFAKSLLLAIIAALLLTYVFGTGLMELLGVHIYLDDDLVSPLQAISVSALFVVLAVLVAAAIIISVFGGIIFIGVVIVCALGAAFLSVFWPILLFALVIYLLVREKPSQQAYR